MSNYIKIPMASDTGIPVASSGAIIDASNWDFSAIAVVNASQSSGPLASSNTGTGAGATFTFTTDVASAITVAVGDTGDGYEVGDTLTVSVPAGGINGDAGAKDVTITLTQAMLAATSSLPEEIMPVDNVIACSASGDNINLITNLVSASGALCYYTVLLDLDGGAAVNDALIQIDSTWRKAVQAENSQPTVEFSTGISAYNLTYTST